MNWNWFGWLGLLSHCLFLTFLAFPNEINWIPYKFASTKLLLALLLAMFSSIVFPVIASIRASRWWLLVALCGVVGVIRFFWVLAA